MSGIKRPLLRVLTGCTAVGKTELALQWAEQNDAEIISCDSLLFYRGMDIGTAKPKTAELARVRHHLIDTNELQDQMDITRYVEAAKNCAQEILGRGKKILVTGGSGFYLKAFFHAVADDVEVDPCIRERVRSLSLAEALAELRALNPAGLGNLDVANPRRVSRGLERCLSSGKTMEVLASEFAAKPAPFEQWETKLIRLERDPAELDQRIAMRVGEMLRSGLYEEVQGLEKQGLRLNASAAKAIGYREVLEVLDGNLRPEELESRIIANTRALVRKQRTWFRTQIPSHPVWHPDKVELGSLLG